MPKMVQRLESKKANLVTRKKRVAAYARVSVSTEELLRSLDAQVSYYSRLIQSNPNWDYAGVFVDRGITGTQTESRDEFNRMLAECEAGNIDIILAADDDRIPVYLKEIIILDMSDKLVF